MQKSELLALRSSQIEAYRSSGQTAAEWCSQNNVSISNLRYWITKSNREKVSSDSSFIAFAPSTPGPSSISIHVNNYRLELNPGFDTALLKELILLLKTL